MTLSAGKGGNGCISFLRELYIPAGPANGGDGGTGGNIFIQAKRGETSLHKLARRSEIRAGRGMNGQGKNQGGERGEDIIIEVPVGTVVREISRHDPVAEEEHRELLEGGSESGREDATPTNAPHVWDREKFLLYPAITPQDVARAEFPRLPRGRRSALAASQPRAPIHLDLSEPMEYPMLLVAGAIGGLGNPHFVTKSAPRPKFATKGEAPTSITLQLELKLLADVGLVGLPNAGKSTLLRAMSNARARVGNWAFTTLQPNVGTVVLDSQQGRPLYRQLKYKTGELRTNFTIADIPGLIQDAHLDRGLGVSFLRHVERARVLAFVIDLSAGNAVTALKALWKEVSEYERMKIQEDKDYVEPVVEWTPYGSVQDAEEHRPTEMIVLNPTKGLPMSPQTISIKSKPWFVAATKADLEGTRDNFVELREYMDRLEKGEEDHPSGSIEEASRIWNGELRAIPISAINGHGIERITEWLVGLLDTR